MTVSLFDYLDQNIGQMSLFFFYEAKIYKLDILKNLLFTKINTREIFKNLPFTKIITHEIRFSLTGKNRYTQKLVHLR